MATKEDTMMDDEEFMREIVRTTLVSMGYDVMEAVNGEAALALCASGSTFRAALLDLTVRSGLGGRETLAALRAFQPDMPVFASSGFSDDPVMACPQDYGFTDSLAKPYRKSQLSALLQKYLSTE